jgi:hypothetical protein
VKKLLAKGADANARTAKAAAGGRGGGGGGLFRQIAGEQTPLLVAAKANRPETMRALVAGGADTRLKARMALRCCWPPPATGTWRQRPIASPGKNTVC